MGKAEDRPVYQLMYRLLMLILDARDKFPKNYRYEFGTELMMSALRCCELIRYANSSLPRRVEYLNEFLVKFDTLKLLLRVCRDRKLINIQTTADIIEMITSIEKQIIGDRKSVV